MLSAKAAKSLADEAGSLTGLHLRDLLADAGRSRGLVYGLDDLRVDLSRQKLRTETVAMLLELASQTGLAKKIEALFAGAHVNQSEDRAVVHMAQRAEARRVSRRYGTFESPCPVRWR